MEKSTTSEQELDLDRMDTFVTLSGAALALGYLNAFSSNPYSLDEFEALAEIFCNHTTATSGKSLQAKYLEWQYYNEKGHPYYLTTTLSNILMARARVERFEEALAVLKFAHAEDTIPFVEKDFALFMQNNPKLVTTKTAPAEKPKSNEKPYTDATDIFMVLEAIEIQPAFFGLQANLDALQGFINGYKLMATENKIKLKNSGKLDHFLFFIEKELNCPSGKYPTWHALLTGEFDAAESYTRFFEYFNKFKMKYKS